MKQAPIFQQRRCGVLLHITSLPAGNLGADAYHFVDFLQQAGVTVWQVLPLGPTHNEGSPYRCLSAHAVNPKLICVDVLKQKSWAEGSELNQPQVDQVIAHAYQQFVERGSEDEKNAFQHFCEQQSFWLDDYVLFSEIHHLYQATAWFDWPEPYRNRDKATLDWFKKEQQQALTIRRFEQYILFEQWYALKQYANQRGVLLFGDMPIFVAHDSADVWVSPELFTLDAQGQVEQVAGVPPDYFSETGQRWGNPLYRWQQHVEQDFVWWQQRFQTQLELFDLVRIDHFRGFAACWEIPASCETAIDGQWVPAPGEALFDKLLSVFGKLPLVAEDLGIITDDVTALREKYAMPGMKILQFAFGGDASNPYLPHQHERRSVTYTGTHDNDTTLGWYNTLDEVARSHVHDYLGDSQEAMPWLLIRVALRSVSALAIIPMQDLLSLGSEHRMNIPGTVDDNWRWQYSWDMVAGECAGNLRQLNQLYGR